MIDTQIPDYAQYSVRELREALGTVNGSKYPDRKSAIERELSRRIPQAEQHDSNHASDIDTAQRFWTQINWIQLGAWFQIVSGLVVAANLIYWSSSDSFHFGIGESILASLGALSLAAGILLRKDVTAGYWLSFLVLAPQTLAISSQPFVWRIVLLGGVDIGATDKDGVWEFGFGSHIGNVDLSIASGGTPGVSVNVFLVFVLWALIHGLRASHANN